MPAPARSAVIILADGARADIFERLLTAGELPEIARHVVARGGYRRASSTFTSTTIPAHLPFLTGRFAGSANIPGYRWFDRSRWRPGLPTGPWCLRSYNGPESLFVDRDISADAPTLFELTRDAVNVFGSITRGLVGDGNVGGSRKNRLWLSAHYRKDYVTADAAASEALLSSFDRDATQVRFAVLPGIDWNSHYVDPFGEATLDAYRRIDRCVGACAEKLQKLGRYEDTLIVVCSDHGHGPVTEHFDLGPRIELDHGLRVAFHKSRAWRRGAEAISCVSGNAMAHVYVKYGKDWREGADRDVIEAAAPGLIQRLLGEPAIDILISRLGNDLLIESPRGRAILREQGDDLVYRPAGSDPFGYPELPEKMSFDLSLALTFDTEYPDALLQITQLFRSGRTGDLVVSAAPGHDLRERFEHPEHRSGHGGLHSDHMHVPLAFSEPATEGPVRTADVFSSVLHWLGVDEPAGLDGSSRLSGDRIAASTAALA